MLKIIIPTLMCLIISTESLLAQSNSSKHIISLDSRYIGQGYSNKAIGKFGIEILNLSTIPADLFLKLGKGSDKNDRTFLFYNSRELRNVGNGLVLFIGSAFLSSSFIFAYHEYGHGTRQAAIGFKPHYGHGSIESEADVQAVLSGSVKLYDNFLSFYLSSIFDTGGFTIVKSDDSLFLPLTKEFNNGWDGLIMAGGMNNEMLFTDFIEDELHRNGGHIGFMIPYLSGKSAAQSYGSSAGVFNDLTNIVAFYENRGYDIDSEKITTASKISLFTSSLSYQLIYQLFRMFSGNSTQFIPWEYRGVQLPNTSFFMNRNGLSYKIRSGYRFNNWRLPIAVEYIFEGDKKAEISLGAEKQFDKLTTTVETIIGERIDIALGASYLATKWCIISGGYALYNKNNLHGERFIPSLKNGSDYHEFYLRASLIY